MDRSRDLLLLGAASAVMLLSKRQPRRYGVRPLNRNRSTSGHFVSLFNDMGAIDHEQFHRYTRMTPARFENLLGIVGPSITKDPTKNPLSPSHRLVLTLQ